MVTVLKRKPVGQKDCSPKGSMSAQPSRKGLASAFSKGNRQQQHHRAPGDAHTHSKAAGSQQFCGLLEGARTGKGYHSFFGEELVTGVRFHHLFSVVCCTESLSKLVLFTKSGFSTNCSVVFLEL